jgi:hypothetical protein
VAWKDKATVSKTYAPILASCGDAATDTVGRVWGNAGDAISSTTAASP